MAFNEILSTALYGFGGLAFTALWVIVGYIAKSLIKSKAAKETFARINKVIQEVVVSVNETYKKKYLEAKEDGKLSEKEKEDLKKIALDGIKKILGDAGQLFLEQYFAKHVEDWLGHKIEEAVFDLKSISKVKALLSNDMEKKTEQ